MLAFSKILAKVDFFYNIIPPFLNKSSNQSVCINAFYKPSLSATDDI